MSRCKKTTKKQRLNKLFKKLHKGSITLSRKALSWNDKKNDFGMENVKYKVKNNLLITKDKLIGKMKINRF